MTSQLSAKITLWCSRVLMAGVLVLAVLLPGALRWYNTLRPLTDSARSAILWGYYICTPAVLYALGMTGKIVRNILAEQVFVLENVRLLRHLRWCCAGVGGVCLVCGVFYPPLLFLAVIMAFLALTVSLVKNVMAAAVELREENDLTV